LLTPSNKMLVNAERKSVSLWDLQNVCRDLEP
jgi:hypothetical protein